MLSLLMATCFPRYPSRGKLINEPGLESWPGQALCSWSRLSCLNPWEWHKPEPGAETTLVQVCKRRSTGCLRAPCTSYVGRLLGPARDRNCLWVVSIPLCRNVPGIRAQHVSHGSSRMSQRSSQHRDGGAGLFRAFAFLFLPDLF